MKSIARILAVGAVLLAVSGPAVAQNVSANPTYGTVNLSGGFSPDPYTVNLQSGGSINAQNISSNCRGYIANAPDVRLNFSPGSLPLIISVASSADTTLIINGPNGQWYCDDDGGANGLNPGIRFNNPQGGQYDIWVGTYGNASLQPAQLYISEAGTR
jgi:hypothetical protein